MLRNSYRSSFGLSFSVYTTPDEQLSSLNENGKLSVICKMVGGVSHILDSNSTMFQTQLTYTEAHRSRFMAFSRFTLLMAQRTQRLVDPNSDAG